MFGVGALFIPCIVGIFFFDEPMSVWQWLGLFLFIVAMYFMVAPAKKQQEEKTTKITVKTILMLLLTLVAGGGTMVAQKAFAKVVPNGSVATYSFLMFALNAIILYTCYAVSLYVGKKKTYSSQPQEIKKDVAPLSKILLICGLALAFAIFIINMLVTELGKSVDSAILFSVSNAISIIITILVGSIYYKEKIMFKNVIGVVLCVGALAIINFL
jgi:drug/metabolite transporter (DMT)-like permease